MEITNTSANPSVTAWNDYEFLYGKTDIMPNDALGLTAGNAYSVQPVPEPATLGLMAVAAIGLLGSRRQKGIVRQR